MHNLLLLETSRHIQSHPKLDASWEGFVLEEIFFGSKIRNIYFWATHAGAELDVLAFLGGRPIGFEIKYTDAPKTTKSMRAAIRDLQLSHLYIVYPGTKTFPLDELITALSINELHGIFVRIQQHPT